MSTDTISYGPPQPWQTMGCFEPEQNPYGNTAFGLSDFKDPLATDIPSPNGFSNMLPPPTPLNSTSPSATTPQSQLQTIQPAPLQESQPQALAGPWPSQLVRSRSAGTMKSPTPEAPSTAPSSPKKSTTGEKEKPRKTLSPEQRKAMCQFHEENPTMRQADIGARFGVERSTVSKVLRNKDVYLGRERDPENTNLKRSKTKNPDFDRTLSIYVRRQQQRGFNITDSEIMEQARMFAHASDDQKTILNSLTENWLQRFKQKHNIGASAPKRRASEPNIGQCTPKPVLIKSAADKVDHRDHSEPVTRDISPAINTPAVVDTTQSRLLPVEEDATHTAPPMAGFAAPHASYPTPAMDTNCVYNFSPNSHTGELPLDPSQVQLIPGPPPSDIINREKRSRTFPMTVHDYEAIPIINDGFSSRYPSTSTLVGSETIDGFNVDPQDGLDMSLTSPPALHRTSSNSSMTGRSCSTPLLNTGLGISTNDSPSAMPSQEDACRAANTLLSYIQGFNCSGQFEQNEFLTVVQLTKKLSIYQQQYLPLRPAMGVLSQIPESDNDLVTCLSCGPADAA